MIFIEKLVDTEFVAAVKKLFEVGSTGSVKLFKVQFLRPYSSKVTKVSSGSGGEGAMPPPSPVEISHKKMDAEGARIDFMFLAPPLTRPLDLLKVAHVGVLRPWLSRL